MADWGKIKREYLNGGTSYRKLSKKYGVSMRQIENVSKREGWTALRKQVAEKAAAKTVDILAQKQADRAMRLQTIADRLMDKLEQAVDELDIQLMRRVVRTKKTEYDKDCWKPTSEISTEVETTEGKKQDIIDRRGLRDITAALRELKEIQMIRTDRDDQEQDARIANLRRQAESDKQDTTIRVEIGGGADDLAD